MKNKSKPAVYCEVEMMQYRIKFVFSSFLWPLLVGLFFLGDANAQTGNEWITYSQEYYRIPVGADGLYRVTFDDLQEAGFPAGTSDPRRLQIFHRGIEQAIHVQGEEDGVFNAPDYIEFYGSKNDGTSDTPLYEPASAQPHTYYNLFSDTTVYFLTVNSFSSFGKRIVKTWEENDAALPLATHHLNEKLIVLTQEHSSGVLYESAIRNTYFDVGEGWTGQMVLDGNTIDYVVDGLTQAVTTASSPQLEMVVAGRSDALSMHRAEIYVGPSSSSLRLIATQDIEQFNSVKIIQALAWSDISAGGLLTVRMRVLATGISRARLSVSSIKITHPQSFDVSGSSETYFYLPENPTGKTFISIQNPPADARLFDVTDPGSIVWYDAPSLTINPVIEGTDNKRKLILTNVVRPINSINKITFRNIVPTQHNYIIISHAALMKPGGNYADPVRAYAAYRASDEGGGYDSLVVPIEQLYDQFNYGEISPLAIHRFMKYMVEGGYPQYLFIIGKGLDWFLNYHRNPQDPKFSLYKDLVPAAGFPASDMYFTIGLGESTYEPAVSTGRISATTPAEVAAYLDKVKEKEVQPYDDLWQKKVIHLSGGLTEKESIDFRRYLEGYASIAEGLYLGGNVKAQAKNTTNVGELINISAEVNEGVNLITFFGHSSATTSDFEVGFVSNPSLGYSNTGKYPMFLVNGCFAGDFFANDKRYGADWVLAQNKGAVGFIAHSYFGFTSTLRYYSDLFYRLAFADSVWMRKGIGDIQQEVARRYMQVLSPNELNLTQISQMFLLGDPAVSVFGATKPDYAIDNSGIVHQSLDGAPVTAYTEAFALQVIVKNFGRAKEDSLHIRVTRTFSDASTESFAYTFAPVYYQDTLTLLINQERYKGFGTNMFYIELDPDNEIGELNEANNSATYELFVPLNLTKNLYPYDFAIVNATSISLKFSSTDILGASRDFELEVDTVNTFTSDFLKKYVVSGTLAEKQFDLLMQDSVVYYWRTRFKDPQEGEVAEWVSSSFVYILGSSEGWAQLHFPQYAKNQTDGLVKDPELEILRFRESALTFDIFTFGSAVELPSSSVSVKVNNEEFIRSDVAIACRNNTINLIAFDKNTTIPYTPITFATLDPRACGKRPQIINSYLANQLLGNSVDIANYMAKVPEGDSVILFTIGNPGIASWSAAIKLQFEAVGLSAAQLSSIQPGEPVVIFAKKGIPPGSAIIHRPSETPVTEQELYVSGTITGRNDEGTMTSSLIGPAQSWDSFTPQVVVSEVPQTDVYSFTISGISLSGEEQVLLSEVISAVDLGFVDATTYPYLRITYTAADPINLTPAQLKKWIVLYTPVAEGVLLYNRPLKNPVVQEGENWTGTFGFKNISQQSFTDSLIVRAGISNQDFRVTENKIKKIKAPLPDQTTQFDLTLPTVGMTGLNDFALFVNPNVLPEQYYDNNQLFLPSFLTVQRDQLKPVLDVTIDGRFVVNGDYVSPDPNIIIRVWDENQFIKITDTDGIQIRLKYPGAAFATSITFDRDDISWSPQTDTEVFRVDFNPVNLQQGKYVLEVEVVDARNNRSGIFPYQVEFEVLYDDRVLLLAPYPNPSSSVIRFDMQVSGEVPPDYMQLRIMAIDGRSVTTFEITDLHIGINRILWEGIDPVGNELPSGLYLYEIVIMKSGESIPISIPPGENFLKGGYGKIVLQR